MKFKALLSTVLALGMLAFSVPSAFAAPLVSLSDTVTRHIISTGSNHVITFQTASTIDANDTITFTFASGDGAGEFFDLSTVTLDDIAYTAGLTGVKPTGATAITTGIAATATDWGISATNGAASTDALITLTAPSGLTTIAAGTTVTITIGATNTITNPGVNSATAAGGNLGSTEATRYSLAVGGTFGDVGSVILPVLSDDQVHVTAEVGSELIFDIQDAADDNGSSFFTDHANAIDFGLLSAAAAKFAVEGATSDGSAATVTGGAHGLKFGTNAPSGGTITVTGATLTNGAGDTITAIGGTAAASAAGTEQFGLCLSLDTTGVAGTDATDTAQNGQIAADFDCGGTGYAFAAGAANTIASGNAAGPTSLTFYDVQYLANITTLTEAGEYATDLTFIATGSF